MYGYDWVFYSLYPGSLEKLDYGIEKLVKPIKEKMLSEFDLNRWFFIRYIDRFGPHVRLRFKVPSAELKKAKNLLENTMPILLKQVSQSSNINHRRLLPISNSSHCSPIKISRELYEPEVKKYGGWYGLKISEELFQVSSDFVCSIIQQINKKKIDRFQLALYIMNQCLELTFFKEQARRMFLKNYLIYWSGDSYLSEDNKMSIKLLRSAMSKKNSVNAMFLEYNTDKINTDLSGYMIKLSNVMKVARETRDIKQQIPQLIFHYMHMMNNRLGVWPIEEAYLSALLMQKNNLDGKSSKFYKVEERLND